MCVVRPAHGNRALLGYSTATPYLQHINSISATEPEQICNTSTAHEHHNCRADSAHSQLSKLHILGIEVFAGMLAAMPHFGLFSCPGERKVLSTVTRADMAQTHGHPEVSRYLLDKACRPWQTCLIACPTYASPISVGPCYIGANNNEYISSSSIYILQ